MKSLAFGMNFTPPTHLSPEWPHFKPPVATVWLVAAMLESSVEAEGVAPTKGSALPLGLRAARGSQVSPDGPRGL